MLNKAIIDLEILRKNALAVKAKLNGATKLNAVVKADAYGHGASVVANALYKIAHSFSVATVEEGILLRLSGIDKQILVLLPTWAEDFGKAVYHNLTLTLDSIKSAYWLEKECEKQNRKALVHIKFNSGMNRAGVDNLKDLNTLACFINNSKWVMLDGMFSHFACPENKKQLKSAQNKFLLANNLIKGYNIRANCHISASGGFLKGVFGDWVRIGLLLYGYKPFDSEFCAVNPIMKVYAPVIKTRKLSSGDRALYGLKKTEGDLDISLIRYGYADGLMRREIDGQFNNRCMDISAVLGNKQGLFPVMENADVLAKQYKTISYEILTKCALKAQKIYLN